MAEKTIEQQLTELKDGLEKFTQAEIKQHIANIEKEVKSIGDKADKTEIKAFNDSIEEIKKSLEENKEWQVSKDEADKKNQEFIDKLAAEKKRKPFSNNGSEVKGFNQYLVEAIEKNADKIRNHRKGQDFRFDLMPEAETKDATVNEEGKREVKAVGDMSIAVNFPQATVLYQDVQQMILSPYNRLWLSDVLPGGTSNGTQLTYPKEGNQDGGASLWEDPTVDKSQIDWNLTAVNVPFEWIAGIVIADRAMLDDIPFLMSYIQNKMLISLKTAENAFILKGTQLTGAVPGLDTVASPYNGSFTDPVDRLIDAAWGQIPDATEQFYSPTNIILNSRDAVKVGLNKASGSGEYNLPAGSVAFVNGKLTIGGLDVIPVSSKIEPYDTFMALDKYATMFIKRMQPELRLFDGDATLAKKNKVMFRIEERATLAVFNNAAIVKGVLQLS